MPEKEVWYMKDLVYVLTDPVGLHARPAGDFVKAVQKLSCNVTLEKGGKKVDAKRLLAVMGLGAKGGAAVDLGAHFLDFRGFDGAHGLDEDVLRSPKLGLA